MISNELKAEARKHALSNGIATAGWTDADFEQYIGENDIKEPKKARKPRKDPKLTPANLDTVLDAIDATDTPAPAEPTQGKVEAAIAELIAATKQDAPAPSIDEDRVRELIEEYSKTPRVTDVVIHQKGKEPKVVKGQHFMYSEVLAYAAAGENTALVGPAGSGKSTMLENIAKELELDYYFQGAVQQEHKIMGSLDANNNYRRTPFREAFENGGVFVFEEADGSHPRALLSANNAVAGDWCDFPDGMVKKHEDFVCFMCMNTYGTGASREYVGRNQLDGASLDRFAFIEMPYDEAMEMQAATAINSEAVSWVHTVQAFRRKVEAAGIRHIVSPRASIKGANLLKHGVSVESITKSLLHKGLSTDQLTQIGLS